MAVSSFMLLTTIVPADTAAELTPAGGTDGRQLATSTTLPQARLHGKRITDELMARFREKCAIRVY
jgi:hypothetical protein